MKNSTSKSLYLWGGSFIALGVIVWGLTLLGGGHDSGTFTPETLTTSEVSEFDQVRGAEDAGVTIVEYSDFQCPACRGAAPIVKQVLDAYPEDVRLVYRHYPIRQIHPQAQSAAEAAEAAGRQGAFWEMHDVLFANQDQWSGNLGSGKIFETYAEALGLDMEQFNIDVNDRALSDKVDHDYRSGVDANVQGTPTFFVNGTPLESRSYDSFIEAIDAELERLAEIAEATIEAGESEGDSEIVGTDVNEGDLSLDCPSCTEICAGNEPSPWPDACPMPMCDCGE